MVTSKKHVFWQALIFTIVIFGIGLIFGYFLENNRSNQSEQEVMRSEITMLDEQLRSRFLSEENISCELAKQSTFSFADKVYEEAQKLEKYTGSNRLNVEILKTIHKRYDLLRTMLWLESIKTKERCNNFYTVIYFFKYDVQDMEIRAEQAYYSRLLVDLKNKYPDKILLIPIANNMDLAAVDLAINNYHLAKNPTILINEKEIVDKVITLKELEEIVFKSKLNY